MPDTLLGYAAFGADHYRPQKSFKSLSTVYPNLFYCCNACNSRKNQYWPPLGQEKTAFVPNPCDHIMFDHLRFNKASVDHHSPAGNFTITLLDLNDPVVVGYRRTILQTIELWLAKQKEIQEDLDEVQRLANAGSMPAAVAAQATADFNDQMADVLINLAVFTGGASAPTAAPKVPKRPPQTAGAPVPTPGAAAAPAPKVKGAPPKPVP